MLKYKFYKNYEKEGNKMNEAQKVLDELQRVSPEKLTGEAKRLFKAIMVIADSRDRAYKELEEKDKIIEELTKKIKIK